MLKQVMEIMDLLDRGTITGSQVVNRFLNIHILSQQAKQFKVRMVLLIL